MHAIHTYNAMLSSAAGVELHEVYVMIGRLTDIHKMVFLCFLLNHQKFVLLSNFLPLCFFFLFN